MAKDISEVNAKRPSCTNKYSVPLPGVWGAGLPPSAGRVRIWTSGLARDRRCLLGCLMVRARREVSKDAGLLVVRHESAVLGRQIGRARYQRLTGYGSRRCRG